MQKVFIEILLLSILTGALFILSQKSRKRSFKRIEYLKEQKRELNEHLKRVANFERVPSVITLKQEEERLFAVDESPEAPAMATLDRKGNFKRINRAFLNFVNLMGWTSDDLIEKPSENILTRNSAEIVKARIRQVDNDIRLHPVFDVLIKPKKGNVPPLILQNTVVFIKNSDNKKLGFRATYVDVTEQRKKEERREKTLERFTSWAEKFTVATLTINEGKIEEVCDTTERIFGYTKSELVTKPADFVIHDDRLLYICFHARELTPDSPDFHEEATFGTSDQTKVFYPVLVDSHEGKITIRLLNMPRTSAATHL